MESLNMIKIKKAKAIHGHTYRRLRKMAALTFRFFELFLFITVVSRFTTQFPSLLAFRISADYFTLSLFSPGSVFLIGNAIILLLFLISAGKQSTNPDYYEDYVKRNHKISNFHHHHHHQLRLTDHHQDIKHDPDVKREPRKKIIEQSESEKKILLVLDRDGPREEKPQGRRPEDEMSSEEFQQTVEDFIARQQRLLREELIFASVPSKD